jgi:divalent metal cation (Fe/Co/Zn/Cd) transporter
LRLIAVTFFVLAAYVTFESGRDLIGREEPAESLVGIILAIVSLIVIPTLAWFKRRPARQWVARS